MKTSLSLFGICLLPCLITAQAYQCPNIETINQALRDHQTTLIDASTGFNNLWILRFSNNFTPPIDKFWGVQIPVGPGKTSSYISCHYTDTTIFFHDLIVENLEAKGPYLAIEHEGYWEVYNDKNTAICQLPSVDIDVNDCIFKGDDSSTIY